MRTRLPLVPLALFLALTGCIESQPEDDPGEDGGTCQPTPCPDGQRPGAGSTPCDLRCTACGDVAPECPPGLERVAGCPAGSAACEEVTSCGFTVICAPVCEAEPACPGGMVEVADCAPAGGMCTPVTVCGLTIFCQPDPAACQGVPYCPDGWLPTETCPEGEICEEVTACGITLLCAPDHVVCDAEPACPAGSEQVADCPDNGQRCDYVTLCEHTIACLYPCGVDADCPAGTAPVAACDDPRFA
ncbi:MAG: hypothetical protein R3F60_10665 [bacterium]